MSNEFVSLEETKRLVGVVIKKIGESKFEPDTILALSTGGFPIAAMLAKRLDVNSRQVIGMPIYKDESGDYHLEDSLVQLGSCINRKVLIVDEASRRGLLTKKMVDVVTAKGGVAKSCVLLAWPEGIQPDYVAQACSADVPDFFWEQV